MHPATVVKGGEWLAGEVREQDEIPSDIEVKIFPLVKGYSSTNVIRRIRNGEDPLNRAAEAIGVQ